MAAVDPDAFVGIVTAMAKSYTRGNGFVGDVPAEDINAVILLAAGRLLANPGQLEVSETMGPFMYDVRGGFTGWTLAETFVLNRYRARAQ